VRFDKRNGRTRRSSERRLEQSDIVSLDLGIKYKGYFTDSAVTLPVLGSMGYQDWMGANPKLLKLLEVTKEALNIAVRQAFAGNKIGRISYTIQKYVEKNGFNVYGISSAMASGGCSMKIPRYRTSEGQIRVQS